MDLKLVIFLALCHYASARPQYVEDNNEQGVISNVRLLVPHLIQNAETGQKSNPQEHLSSDNTHSQFLPMPIQAFSQLKDKSGQSETENQNYLQKLLQPNNKSPQFDKKKQNFPRDGPFSNIPSEAFQINRSKKDLSSEPQVTIVPKDLVQQCNSYFRGTLLPSPGKEELILDVCTELLDVGAMKDFAVGTTTPPTNTVHQTLESRDDTGKTSSRAMDDDEFIQRVSEFTQNAEESESKKHDSENQEYENYVESIKQNDNVDGSSNSGELNERSDDNIFHQFTNLEEFENHKKSHEFKSLDDLKNNEDNLLHGFEFFEELKNKNNRLPELTNNAGLEKANDNEITNIGGLEKYDDSNFYNVSNLGESKAYGDKQELNVEDFKGSDAKVAHNKGLTEPNFRIDIGEDRGKDLSHVIGGNAPLMKCNCHPLGVHKPRADDTPRHKSEQIYLTLLEYILELLAPALRQK